MPVIHGDIQLAKLASVQRHSLPSKVKLCRIENLPDEGASGRSLTSPHNQLQNNTGWVYLRKKPSRTQLLVEPAVIVTTIATVC